ncbi:MAG: phosphoribosylformylglycinamidine synthase subunit PurQ, partial [Clostridia bacterium]|nr:phosphoribosylformylglycinamidine synthase subunit PurQ [Clostridia bacterium]
SESQERMAVVVDESDVEAFIQYADEENLEAVTVAKVTNDGRFRMTWRGQCILNLKRAFLDTNGVQQKRSIKVQMPKKQENFFKISSDLTGTVKYNWMNHLKDLNIASQKGLVERFDSTIGKSTVLMPLGGKYQLTPAEGMAAKLPVQHKETDTATLMTFGYHPKLSKWSPFHGAFYAVIESVTKLAAMGGDYSKTRLSFQEYFEKLGEDSYRWGKPFAALLGALKVQKELEIAAIGGKDSMSGTFMDLDVPPTLISFAVGTTDAKYVLSPEFKKNDSLLVWVYCSRDENELINLEQYKEQMDCICQLIRQGKVLSAKTVGYGGIAAAVSKMAMGNMIGAHIEGLLKQELFDPAFGSILLEIDKKENIFHLLKNVEYKIIGKTQPEKEIHVSGEKLRLQDMVEEWMHPLEKVFPTKDQLSGDLIFKPYNKRGTVKSSLNIAKPRVLIPAFPGTNCEEDSRKSFDQAGAETKIQIFRNLTQNALKDSIEELVKNIKASQIIMIPGGFSGGDEPDGSAKFITAVFRNPKVTEAVMDLIQRDGLMLGICNGFQALIKLGLVPYGEIRELTEDDPTLTYNRIGRHASNLVRTKIVSVKSPWLNQVEVGDIHTIPISHGEGRFIVKEALMNTLIENGQVATQYVDFNGNPTYDIRFNPNGSHGAIEGITSLDGRIFGKMGHSERIGEHLYKNVQGETDQKIFESGVNYYK